MVPLKHTTNPTKKQKQASHYYVDGQIKDRRLCIRWKKNAKIGLLMNGGKPSSTEVVNMKTWFKQEVISGFSNLQYISTQLLNIFLWKLSGTFTIRTGVVVQISQVPEKIHIN